MDAIILIGRILFALIFISSGIAGHFMALEQSSQYADMKGVRPAKPAVIVSGIVILLGGLSIILGLWMDLGALLIVIFALSAAFLMHNFWTIEDPMERQMEMTQFMKDTALAGGALVILGMTQLMGDDLGLTLTGPLF